MQILEGRRKPTGHACIPQIDRGVPARGVHQRSSERLLLDKIRKHRLGEQADGRYHDIEGVPLPCRSGQPPCVAVGMPMRRGDFGVQPQVRSEFVALSALLEVLDPRQNNAFVDRYLDVPFDLSQVIFIGTANYIEGIPEPLRDRIEVMSLPGYTEREKLEIAERYLVPRQLEENGLKSEQCEFREDALRRIISDYTHEAGVRELERQIGAVCRGIAAQVARGKTDHVTVTPQVVAEMLGPAKYVRETKLKTSKPGVVTGLAYTPTGGEVLHIEATRYLGKGNITLTGQIGNVMKESVQAALSLLRSRDGQLGVDAEDFRKMDIHVHVPAGAVPKDGPSAGIAMFTALASLFSNRPVRSDVAMTGEITLRGLVLPIGGLKEKSLAAMRAGISTVIIPKLNEKDLVDVPEEAKQKLQFIPVENVDEVLAVALEKNGAPSASKPKSA